ncbi:MAG: diguanylate cyclase [Myxococcales bacterium]|nr:diguanylate cyclase [Myxococcales bacterium]
MSTLLVIEDSASQRAEIQAALAESVAFDRILEAEDGLQGLRLLVSEDVDVVLCDLHLPGLAGEKLLNMRNSTASRVDVPFLFLTAEQDAGRRTKLLRGGASDSILKPFHPADLVARLELHLKIVRLQHELLHKNEMLERLSTTDALTGLRNRRFLTDILSVEFLRSRRFELPLSVVMLDLDHFKAVNDQHGHAAGDAVLRAVGDRLAAILRGSDHGGRYGGEEFLMVIGSTDLEGALVCAERLRSSIEECEVRIDDGSVLKVTASLGVAAISEAHETPGDLVAAADEALYRAKEGGRNQVRGAAS